MILNQKIKEVKKKCNSEKRNYNKKKWVKKGMCRGK